MNESKYVVIIYALLYTIFLVLRIRTIPFIIVNTTLIKYLLISTNYLIRGNEVHKE